MGKRVEVHSRVSVVVGLVTLLDSILRLDEDFEKRCVRGRRDIVFRIIDKDDVCLNVIEDEETREHRWVKALVILVEPIWWPKDVEVKFWIVRGCENEWYVPKVTLVVPQFPSENWRYPIILTTAPNPPYFFGFEPSNNYYDKVQLRYFQSLCRKLFRAADVR